MLWLWLNVICLYKICYGVSTTSEDILSEEQKEKLQKIKTNTHFLESEFGESADRNVPGVDLNTAEADQVFSSMLTHNLMILKKTKQVDVIPLSDHVLTVPKINLTALFDGRLPKELDHKNNFYVKIYDLIREACPAYFNPDLIESALMKVGIPQSVGHRFQSWPLCLEQYISSVAFAELEPALRGAGDSTSVGRHTFFLLREAIHSGGWSWILDSSPHGSNICGSYSKYFGYPSWYCEWLSDMFTVAQQMERMSTFISPVEFAFYGTSLLQLSGSLNDSSDCERSCLDDIRIPEDIKNNKFEKRRFILSAGSGHAFYKLAQMSNQVLSKEAEHLLTHYYHSAMNKWRSIVPQFLFMTNYGIFIGICQETLSRVSSPINQHNNQILSFAEHSIPINTTSNQLGIYGFNVGQSVPFPSVEYSSLDEYRSAVQVALSKADQQLNHTLQSERSVRDHIPDDNEN